MQVLFCQSKGDGGKFYFFLHFFVDKPEKTNTLSLRGSERRSNLHDEKCNMRVLHLSDVSVIGTDGNIAKAVESVSETFLRGVVQTVSIPRNFVFEPLNNRFIAEWITEQLRSYGYKPFYQGRYENIIAFPSEQIPGTVILIGAHYDSVPKTPGADDNASAVAALLSCAKAVAEYAEHIPVGFVAFNREEDGMVGSTDFVNNYVSKNTIHIQQAHILEMVGYCSHRPKSQQFPKGLPVKVSDTGDFLGVIANQDSNALIERILRQAKSYFPNFPVLGLQVYAGLEKYFPPLSRSDHAPFWKAGIPALLWTDTSEFRNPNYHQTTDTPGTLDYAFLRKVTQLLLLHTLLFKK
jgi:hypothetical protein